MSNIRQPNEQAESEGISVAEEDQADQAQLTTKIKQLLESKGTDVSTIAPSQKAVEAAKIMAEERIGVLVCCIDPTVVSGVISERDIVRTFAEQPDRIAELNVVDLMTKNVEVCSPSDDLRDVMKTMRRGGFRHVPVIYEGRLRGLVSTTDILMFYIQNAHLGDRQLVIDLMFASGQFYPGG